MNRSAKRFVRYKNLSIDDAITVVERLTKCISIYEDLEWCKGNFAYDIYNQPVSPWDNDVGAVCAAGCLRRGVPRPKNTNKYVIDYAHIYFQQFVIEEEKQKEVGSIPTWNDNIKYQGYTPEGKEYVVEMFRKARDVMKFQVAKMSK